MRNVRTPQGGIFFDSHCIQLPSSDQLGGGIDGIGLSVDL